MSKIDLTKEHKAYFTATATPQLVTIEPAQYVSIMGNGDPSDKDFADKIQAMYSVAYAIKFYYKEARKDFTVSKLEAQWWFDENKFGKPSIEEAPIKVPRTEWEYRLLIRLPEYATEQDVENAIKTVFAKKGLALSKEVSLYKMEEGDSIQILHVGPFDTEPESLSKIKDLIQRNGFSQNGLHHEIYLSDFRKVLPDKIRTILREPVR